MFKSVSPARLAVAAIVLGALAGPAYAANEPTSSMMTGPEDMEQAAPVQGQPSAMGQPSGMSSSSYTGKSSSGMMKAHTPAGMSAQVEKRISTLHAKLRITPAQENEWNDVAQAMRDNEKSISQLIENRHQNAKEMSAVDDLASYQKITQAHADGMGKVVSAFQTLYDDMSDSQKKNADEVFGRFEGHRGVDKASAKKSVPAAPSSTNE